MVGQTNQRAYLPGLTAIRHDGGGSLSLSAQIRGAIIANLPVFNNPPQSASGQSLAFGLGCSGQPSADDGGELVDVEISNAGNNSYTIGHVLYRAGALIALDANAHTFLPSLPGPSAHELAIARQLGYHG